MHAHHAIQVCIALRSTLHVRSRAGPWRRLEAAIIPSDEPHQIDGAESEAALLYLDPETPEARSLRDRYPHGKITSLRGRDLAAFRAAASTSLRPDPTGEIDGIRLDSILDHLTTPSDAGAVTDARILATIETLRAAGHRRLPLATLARGVGLSAGRLGHLFRSEVGLPIRRYRLWLRLADAVDEIARGAPLTAAAHEAGFSDSAHLARTFRRMFGITPSSLLFVRFLRVAHTLGPARHE